MGDNAESREVFIQFMLAAGNGKNRAAVPLNRLRDGIVGGRVAGVQRNHQINRILRQKPAISPT